jgi:hypothetical protein
MKELKNNNTETFKQDDDDVTFTARWKGGDLLQRHYGTSVYTIQIFQQLLTNGVLVCNFLTEHQLIKYIRLRS